MLAMTNNLGYNQDGNCLKAYVSTLLGGLVGGLASYLIPNHNLFSLSTFACTTLGSIAAIPFIRREEVKLSKLERTIEIDS